MKKHRKKYHIKKSLRPVIIGLIAIIILFTFPPTRNIIQSIFTGYKVSTIKEIHRQKVYRKVKKHKYSKTLDNIIKNDSYNIKYLDNYLDITYLDRKDFLEHITTLSSLGYTATDINNIYSVLSDEDILLFLENDYLKDISNILKLNYFNSQNLSKYLTYKDADNYTDLVTYVNIGLDHDYYTEVNKIENTDDILVLVNKYHVLDSKYVPEDLETVSDEYNRGFNNKMRKVAKEAFEKMAKAAKEDNISIYSGSAYRSYNYQKNLYDRYVKNEGFKAAETFSARAGYSEHQTGLATDVMKNSSDFISASDKEYTWLVNNSYKYGFILRYPKDKEKITGYMYEEWHYRYVGKDVAKELYDSGLTFDEYIARKSKND